MKINVKLFCVTLIFLITQITIGLPSSFAQGENMEKFAPDDIGIAPNAVRIPIGRILLVRRNSEYCAIKIIKLWTVETKQDRYAIYESYFQGDKTGDFLNRNVEVLKEDLSFPKPRGIGRFAFSFGNLDIKCGSLTLACYAERWVYFSSSSRNEPDYDIELSPTKWTDISEVNVFDSRLRWYKYDSKRQDLKIHVDDLWKDNNDKKTNENGLGLSEEN